MKYQSLHSHTIVSDGKLTHRQLLGACARNGIGVVAFTDHDVLPDEKQLRELNKLREHATKWIVGVELSSELPKEIGGSGSMYHIVGLFVDPRDSNLLSHCEEAREFRIKGAKETVENLANFGFDITFGDVLKEAKGVSIGRPHIASVLLGKKKNLKILKETLKKMKAESKENPELKERYERVMVRGEEQYPYAFFLSSGAYIKGVYVTYGDIRDHDEIVELIRNSGGLAILAHPFFTRDRVDIKVMEKLFNEGRLDGAEVVYAPDAAEWRNEIIDSMKSIDELCDKMKALKSGGADLHDEKDIKIFINEGKKDFAQKTVGMAEEIIVKSNPNVDWSSIKPARLNRKSTGN